MMNCALLGLLRGIVVMAALALAACGAIPSEEMLSAEPSAATIYAVERDWHTDIALPAAALEGPLAPLRERFAGAAYFVIGFGDRAYLHEERL